MKVQRIKFFHSVKTGVAEKSYIDKADRVSEDLDINVDVSKNLVTITQISTGAVVYTNFNNVIYFVEQLDN